MKVNILINNTKLALDDVDPQETIESIKDILYGKLKDTVSAPLPDNPHIHSFLSIHHLRLLYKGKQLPKLSTLQEHGFKEDDTLLLFISQKQQEDPQDDKNEVIHSTIGDVDRNLKYTLKMKNDHKVAEAPDAEMMEELRDDELFQLLHRLPYGIPEDETAIIPPKFDREMAVPKKAKKIAAPFPPSTSGTLSLPPSVLPPVARVLPLAVESYSPVSQIHIDVPIRVKFTQPMMALSDFSRLQSSLPVPVSIVPSVPGSWAWSDPFTAVFTPQGSQFPKSTTYVCTVKGAITSAIGGVMRDAVEWSFSTAPLSFLNRVVSFSGKHIQVLVVFNQPIDVDKVFKSLIVLTTDDELLDIRRIDPTQDEAKLHYTIKKEIQRDVKPGEFIIFEIEDDINGIGQKNSKPIEVEVCVSPTILDLPKQISFKFKTVGALQVRPVERYDKKMKPVEWTTVRNLTVTFTNPLLPVSPSELAHYVVVSPPIKDMKLSVDSTSLSISGTKRAGEHKVTLKKGIMDTYAQILEEDTTVSFPVTAPSDAHIEIAYQRAVASGSRFGSYFSSRNSFITLDPCLPPVLHVSTVNVRSLQVRAYAISSLQHYKGFTEFLESQAKQFPTFLHEVWRKSIDVVPQIEEGDNTKSWHLESRTAIDLAKPFGCDDSKMCGKSKESQIVLVVSADDTTAPLETILCKKLWLTWSDIGVNYIADGDTIYGWSYSLLNGELLNSNMYLCNAAGDTLPLEKMKDTQAGGAFVQANGNSKSAYKFLTAEIGNRSAFVHVDNIFNGYPKDKFVWHVVDDRARYRPFDRVYIKGMIRERDNATGKILLPKSNSTLTYTVTDARSKLIINTTTVEVKSSYCFSFDFELPGTINLGLTIVTFTWGNVTHTHSVDVQEYKRKAFNMVLAKDKTSLKSDEPLLLTSYAQSFTNEVLSGTSSSWSVTVDPASYFPAGLSSYSFGLNEKLAGDAKKHEKYIWDSPKNYSGKHLLSVAVEQIQVPVVVSVSCTVKDCNTNEELNASERVVVHPTDTYVGIKHEQQFVNFGESFKFFAVTCTPDGKFTGDCSLQMFVRGTPFETFDGEVLPPDTAVIDATLTPSDVGPIEFSFQPKFRGKHSVTLVATDLAGRTSSTSAEFWVYGVQTEAERDYEAVKKKEKEHPIEKNPLPHVKSTVDNVKLVLDKSDSYEPGSVAEVLVVAPFWPAQGTYYIQKSGRVIKAEQFTVTESMTRLKVEIKEEFLPKVTFGVVLSGMQERVPLAIEGETAQEPEQKRAKKEDSPTANPLLKPSQASTTTNIHVSFEHKKLEVIITPTDEKHSAGIFLPGDEVSVDVKVVGPNGKPIDGAEVTMVVVDEAVLSLTGYKLGDPRDVFYTSDFSQVSQQSNYRDIIFTRIIPKLALPLPFSPDDNKFITIQYFSGRVLRFEVDSSLPVAKLRSLIQDRDGLPPATQRLLYNGKQLTDEGTLQSQGIPNGATINLVLRLFGGGGGLDEKADPDFAPPPIRIRTNMNALAYFGPHLKTNELGKLTTTFTLPDSLTRYRVMAIANTIDQFGAGESSLIASLPLMLRQAPPRFLNYGDECVLPVIVQNERDEAKEVVVGIRGANVQIANPGWKFKIPARGRISVPFTIRPKGPGKAVFQVAASDTTFTTSDAAMFNINVHAPTTLECVAITGAVDGDNVVVQPIASFSDGESQDSGDGVVRSAGGMEVSIASTLFQELTDSALYLIKYPYECTEQLSSKLITFVAFKDMLPLLHKRTRTEKDKDLAPTPENIGTLVKEIINTLSDRKDSSGSFGYWEKHGNSYDYVSVYVYHALAFAHANNFEVLPSLLASARTFLREIINKYTQSAVKEEKEEKGVKEPLSARALRWARRSTPTVTLSSTAHHGADADAKHALACYAMYVLSLVAGPEGKSEEASKMLSRTKLEKTSPELISWLMPTILGKQNLKVAKRPVWDHITNSITQTGNTAHFVESSWSQGNNIFLNSNVRSDAVALHMLLETDSKHPAIPKLVRGLLDARKNGSWYNTQDNAFAQIAMHKYFKLFEEFSSYQADLWIGKGHVMHTDFNGVSTDTHVLAVPMSHLIDEGESNVTISKRGQGRMYYRIAVEYAPKALFLPPRECGFKVTRSYHAVSDPKDVEHAVDEQGRTVCNIKAGSKVLIKVELVADSMRSHVALVDYLPAGLEPQNASARGTGTNTGFSYVYRFWSHQNVRDSRVEVFIDTLYPGLYKYAYTVKAITKGTFVAPPTKAEEMYSPEVFGRSNMMVVNVK